MVVVLTAKYVKKTSMSTSARWIIRTHDRMMFKKCRELWNFGSKIRENWEPNEDPEYFNFGSAIHAGMEAFYNPLTWGEQLQLELALCAFVDKWQEYQIHYKQFANMSRWEEQKVLGIEMLKAYAEWSKIHDKDLTPIATELEFEVPIPFPKVSHDKRHILNSLGFCEVCLTIGDLKSYLSYKGKVVYYQGRIDHLARDKFGNLYLDDTKTKEAALSEDGMQFLELDEQLGSYAWALRELGQPVKGIFYTQLQKKLVTGPELLIRNLKSGETKIALSKNKQQNTTVELYEKAISEHGLNREDYEEFLNWLEINPNKSIQRIKTNRTDTELNNLGQQIALEAIDMLNDPSIYPNPVPGWWGCDRCKFRTPCLAKRDGSNPEYYLEEMFHIRSPSE